MYADVAVCLPLSRTFVYQLTQPAEVGCRVVLPFRKREEDGFVVSTRTEAPRETQVQSVLKLVDPQTLIRPDIFNLCRWISDYYLAPLGEVLKAALAPGITQAHIEPGLKPLEVAGRPSVDRSIGPASLTTDQLSALFAIQETTGFHTVL